MTDMIGEAHVIIDLLVEKLHSDPATYAHPNGWDVVRENASLLKSFLAGSRPAHPEYACLPETAAALVILWMHDAARYAGLMRGIAREDEAMTLDSVEGLSHLCYFLRVLQDDHDYILDRKATLPTLHMDGTLPHFEPLITPRSLLDALLSGLPSGRAGSPES